MRADAWGLCAVSSDGQMESLPYQEAWIRERAAENEWTLGPIYGLDRSATGKNGVRATVREMVDAIRDTPKAQRPKRVLLIRTDRLGRELLEVMALLYELRDLGITLHTRTDGDLGLSRVTEQLPTLFHAVLAAQENEVRRDKASAVYSRKKRALEEHRKTRQAVEGRAIAVSPRAPYGLRFDDGYFVPKPPESDAVKLAFEMKCAGYGAHKIAKKLADVAPPLTRKDGTEVSQHWENGRVLGLLKMDVYRGVVVDEATWLRAQRPLREVAQPTRRWPWPLGGALQCVCGLPLVGLAGSQPERWRWYMCRNLPAHGGKSVCHRNTLIEDQFVSLLAELAASPDIVAKYTKAADTGDRKLALARLSQLRAELSKHDERRKRLLRGYEDSVVGDADYRERMAELKAEYEAHRNEADQLEREVAVANANRLSASQANGVLQDAARVWATADNDDRRAIAKAVGKVVGGLVVLRDGKLTAKGQSEAERPSAQKQQRS